jgi:hypothetical protein
MTTTANTGYGQGITVTIDIPDLREASDETVADFVRTRDGRWNAQTKVMLAQFKTTKLDLNSWWASTRTGWVCPCCKRAKPQIARLSNGSVLLCRLEFHHDHLADRAKRIFREINPRSDDRETNIQSGRVKNALMLFVERFEETLICIDCNLSEGRVKLELAREIDPDFTFSPSEIASFVRVEPNRLHEVDFSQARMVWQAAKDDVMDRLDFAARMAQRFVKGRHRREVAPGERFQGYLDERSVVFQQFLRAAPKTYRHDIGFTIEARSTANDSAGQSLKPKRKALAVAPTDLEFAEFNRLQQHSKSWVAAGEGWSCAGCDRSKRDIVRKSNKEKWTGRIHKVLVYEREDCEESLRRRRAYTANPIVIGSHSRVTICQDCRNIVAEVMRRSKGLTEDSLSLDDVRSLVGVPTSNSGHEIDWDDAIARAIGNQSLIDAISGYRDHRQTAEETEKELRSLMAIPGIPRSKARDILGYEFAKAHDLDLEEGDAQIDWLIDEGLRLRRLDKLLL